MAEMNDNIVNQYLTFMLDEVMYALEISQVREVLDEASITKVPQMPAYMRGVINLRGNGVPVIDLKKKFGLGDTKQTVNTCIIIAEVADHTMVIGAMADAVQEVIELQPDQIDKAPKLGTRLNTEYIKGMGKREDEFIIILDIDRIFSFDELAVAQEAKSVASLDDEPVDNPSTDPEKATDESGVAAD